jgi:hypothetical protein
MYLDFYCNTTRHPILVLYSDQFITKTLVKLKWL